MIKRGRQRILIVDDERLNLNILSELLRPSHTVILAKSGQKGLERARNQRPDLILLDVLMPEMDGFQVIRELKRYASTRDIPVIFISALGHAEDEEKGLLLGAVDYIVKPFHPAIVMARVRNHLKIVRQRKLLEQIAMLDGLTEMPNRRSFMERFSVEWRRAARSGTPLSLAMVDVDYFKQFNDNYGHASGDEALKAVASVLVGGLRRAADFTARFGGEEFVMLMPDTAAEGARGLCEKIRAEVESLHIRHDHSAASENLTISIGGATETPDANLSGQSLIRRADQMLYTAKAGGRNRVCWNTEHDELERVFLKEGFIFHGRL